MDDQFRQMVIDMLRRGKDLPKEWARELFPPEKREYELVYYGKEREEDILAETMAVPLQPVRTFGKGSSKDDCQNMLIFGDNLQVLKSLLQMKEEGRLRNADGTPGVRLVYIDPPFATKQEFRGSQEQKAYQDKIVGSQFLEFLRKRLVFLREILSNNGSIFVHLDQRKGYHIKLLLDEIFNEHNFRNEIIWHYDIGARGKREFATKHENIFWYTRARDYVFNDNDVVVPFASKMTEWRYTKGGQAGKEMPKGKIPSDVWDGIYLNAMSKEHIGYPTQKPEKLLERIIMACSGRGDLVLDAFAGSGTTLAVAEKLGRHWIGIDCGKLAIYTIQKRMLSLKAEISNKGKALPPKPFTLYNAGLYDFSKLRLLPRREWRFFALNLFGCKDEPHNIGGLQLDGKYKGASVLVFNHHENPGKRIDEETIQSIHASLSDKVGTRFFIIAPRGVFDFQQDYLDLGGVRYYALRIPYSVIHELHRNPFTALRQPSDENAINETVDAVGFDFIHPPHVEWKVGQKPPDQAFIKIKAFKSQARLHGEETYGGLETFSMLLMDYDFDGDVFSLDSVFYARQLEEQKWKAIFPAENIGKQVMVVFMDIHGNESIEVIPREKFME